VKTEIGEYVVGAYLKVIERCHFVEYNVRPAQGGIGGLAEFDVVGLRHADSTAFVCEVTTHLDGLSYGSYDRTIQKIRDKAGRQRQYAEGHLGGFAVHYMFWSPVVRRGVITTALERIEGLELIINGEYRDGVEKLKREAAKSTRDMGNPFFRALQLLEHIRP